MCEIRAALLAYDRAPMLFMGVLTRETFLRADAPDLCIINTDDSNQPGGHWVDVYIFDDGYNFFDSAHLLSSFPTTPSTSTLLLLE